MKTLTRTKANRIVAEEFRSWGTSRCVPVITDEWDLSDGAYWEPAKETAWPLRAQCRRWIKDCE